MYGRFFLQIWNGNQGRLRTLNQVYYRYPVHLDVNPIPYWISIQHIIRKSKRGEQISAPQSFVTKLLGIIYRYRYSFYRILDSDLEQEPSDHIKEKIEGRAVFRIRNDFMWIRARIQLFKRMRMRIRIQFWKWMRIRIQVER
jgi:hypothetical protein